MLRGAPAPCPTPPTMLPTPTEQRLHQIQLARHAVLDEGRTLAEALPDAWADRGWLERSWRRCLQAGLQPDRPVSFDLVSAQAARRSEEASRTLLQAARPELARLGRAIASTRYFAVLTDANGIVVDANGAIDHGDGRAHAIARIGVDLSERSVGTTAIGAALSELQPVWLHRGEHFFADTSIYSCAGAPLFGPDGRCAGMLDLTGIETIERPELKHLVAQSARSIENAMTLARPHSVLVRLNWPGRALGDESDGLVCLDGDGWVAGANQTARQMVPQLGGSATTRHASELFAMAYESLFDAARRDPEPIEVPLWSGLRLQALPLPAGHPPVAVGAPRPGLPSERRPLKDLEIALIRKAVAEARGNVMEAARALGISRATVYRKLGAAKKK